MASNMKKQYIFLGVVLVLVAAATSLAVYKYNKQPKGITLTQAVHQRDDALVNLKIEKQLDAVHQEAITNLTNDKNQLTAQKATICAQVKAARLVQPLCQ
jgi:hypothetical protein